jgi:hypothetical protein
MAVVRKRPVDREQGWDPSTAKVVRRGPKKTMRLTLRELREASAKTQVEVADALGTDQAVISRLEKADDMQLSRLRAYVKALGHELELSIRSDKGHVIQLKIE